MAQVLSIISTMTALAAVFWLLWRARHTGITVRLRLDRSAPGAHLMWNISNTGPAPVTVTRLVIRTARTGVDSIPLRAPHLLRPQEQVLLPTDVDWTLLSARSMAVADREGREHEVSRRQLAAIQEQLRTLIERRAYYAPSARAWLLGAADMAFGFVILGLGFFMLLWVIATG
jgi:hypothetical protein